MLRPYQQEAVTKGLLALEKYRNTLIVMPMGCHAKGTEILMYDGSFKNVEDILIGDKIMGPDSSKRTILELHNGFSEMFKVTPVKGESFTVNKDHILSLMRTNSGIKGDNKYCKQPGTIVNISVEDYLKKSNHFKNLYKIYRKPANFKKDKAELPIDPYFLGILIGDGTLLSTPIITTMDKEIVDTIYEEASNSGLKIAIISQGSSKASGYSISLKSGLKNPLTKKLKHLGLHGKKSPYKFVPSQYKTSSKENRRKILAGLLDTDGNKNRSGTEFCSASKILAYDVAFIARSLGFRAVPKIKMVKGGTYYRFNISGDFSLIPMKVKHKIPDKRRQKKDVLRTGFSVESVGIGEYFGFAVNKDHLYLMGDFTVTHNSGKTITLSKLVRDFLYDSPTEAKALILGHRVEIFNQNKLKFELISNQNIAISEVNQSKKDFSGQVVFAMNQTLMRDKLLLQMPKFDLVVIDEVHRAASNGYERILDRVRKLNERTAILGVTATPLRSDKRTLHKFFNNISTEIDLHTLIKDGILVAPVTYVIEGLQTKALTDYDATHKGGSELQKERAYSDIIAHKVKLEDVFKHWLEKAGTRRTVIFAPSIAVSNDVTKFFNEHGIHGVSIDANTTPFHRHRFLDNFKTGKFQFISNVSLLTEGWDCPEVECILLLKGNSYKSAYLQMIGRGLRSHPGKKDCIVLDFGISTLTLGNLEQDIRKALEAPILSPALAPSKSCPECAAELPWRTMICALCGFEFKAKENLKTDFKMEVFEFLKKTKYSFYSPHENLYIYNTKEISFFIIKEPTGEYVPVNKTPIYPTFPRSVDLIENKPVRTFLRLTAYHKKKAQAVHLGCCYIREEDEIYEERKIALFEKIMDSAISCVDKAASMTLDISVDIKKISYSEEYTLATRGLKKNGLTLIQKRCILSYLEAFEPIRQVIKNNGETTKMTLQWIKE